VRMQGMEGRDRSLFQDIIPKLDWRKWRSSWKALNLE